MLAAYLRGLLKPEHHYGLRSAMAENMVLEAMTYDRESVDLLRMAQVDAQMIPNLDEESRATAFRRVAARVSRSQELATMGIYHYDRNRDSVQGKIPLSNLFQIMRREGMLQPMKPGEFERIREQATPIFGYD